MAGDIGLSNRRMLSAWRAVLLATSSAAALAMNAGANKAAAACLTVTGASGTVNVAGQTCAVFTNATVTGPVINNGVFGPNGLTVTNSTINGAGGGGISHFGDTFGGGISIDAASHVTGITAVGVAGSGAFSGGVTNAGTLTATVATGISMGLLTTFSGGISNSGTITAAFNGIAIFDNIPVGAFSGGIVNTGTINSLAGNGIIVSLLSLFSGGITNTGTITGINGISAGAASPNGVSTFIGGITNNGNITASNLGIRLVNVPSFVGNVVNDGSIVANNGIQVLGGVTFAAGSSIVNSGTITGSTASIDASAAPSPVTIDQIAGVLNGAVLLSPNADVLNVTGGIINGNIVGLGSSDTVNFAPGAGNIFTYAAPFGFSGVNQVNINSGTVVLNGVNSANVVAVNDFGTLSGIGTVNAPVSINSGGALAPGTPGAPGAPGAITLGPLTLNSGSILSYRLGTPNVVGGPTNDLANVNGALTINGDSLFVTNSAGFAPGTYRLINYTVGAAPGGTGNIAVGALPDGDIGVIQTSIPGQVNLIVTAAPPTTQFWDGANMTANGVVDGGTGTWNNTSTNWTNETGTANTSWQGISAIFAGAPGTVTVADKIAYQSMQFSTGGYLLTASAGGTLVPTGVAPIIVDGGLTATIAAPITGSGGVDKNGLGTLILTGANNYTGGTTISFGTLQIGNGGTAGSLLGDVTNNGTLAFNRSDTVTFPGVISGSGELTQLGPGTLVLTGNSTYTGPTNVQGGALEVNGSIAGSSLTIVNTMLLGTGTVGNAQVDNGGIFAPGNGTPGTSMTVAGNLTFQPDAQYMVFVNPSTSSFATVTGTASLAGTVVASFAPGSYVTKQYVILQSAGISGTFSGLTITGLGPGLVTSLSYSADDAFLNLTAALGAGTALNVNQQSVSNALNNFFNSGGALPPGFVNVFNLTGANLANALTLLDGEAATGAERSTFGLMSQFLNLMTDPYTSCSVMDLGDPNNCRELRAIGFAPDQAASFPPAIALAYNAVLKAPPAPPATFAQRWTAWGAAFGGTNHANGDQVIGSTNVTASDFGFAAGMDYHYSPGTLLGFALAGAGTNWGLAQGLGTGRSDAFMAGVHGATHLGPVYLAGSFGFADHWFTTDRTSFGGDQLRANFNGQSYGARLESGYRFALPLERTVVGISPYAAVQAQWFHTPTYSETDLTGGGFGLTYNAMTANDTRSELGARFDALTTFYRWPLVLRGRIAWAHDWVDNPALGAAFQALPGSAFTVFGAPIPHDSAVTTASAELHFAPNWLFTAKFDGEFASDSQTYAGTGTLRYTW
jgi:autotransporter-associated beta strand protein